ncbi:MAG: hypothetical protein AB1756_06725 [Acidobacteriota bacterium]
MKKETGMSRRIIVISPIKTQSWHFLIGTLKKVIIIYAKLTYYFSIIKYTVL